MSGKLDHLEAGVAVVEISPHYSREIRKVTKEVHSATSTLRYHRFVATRQQDHQRADQRQERHQRQQGANHNSRSSTKQKKKSDRDRITTIPINIAKA